MPLRDYSGYLRDILEAGQKIQSYTAGKTFSDYQNDELLRSAVERKFTILAEALNQARQHYPQVQSQISNQRAINAFRNQLIHAYAQIDNKVVWGIIQDDLGQLLTEASTALVNAAEENSGS
ncbi:MAG: DUF86 domain-containing protein [Trueperaceae bacterium]|nr:DUF86 domain-containing protein [Trueperaceae bacterium]